MTSSIKKNDESGTWALCLVVLAVVIGTLLYSVGSMEKARGNSKILAELETCAKIDEGKLPLANMARIDCKVIGLTYFNDCVKWDYDVCKENHLVRSPVDRYIWKTNSSNLEHDFYPISVPEKLTDCRLVDSYGEWRYMGCYQK